jgi:COP9 signalosome complex subunit 6
MQVDGEEPTLNIKFRALPYSVETGESEMIGIDTIVQASGTASLNATHEPTKRAKKPEAAGPSAQSELSQEEEECMFRCLKRVCYSPVVLTFDIVIASLTTRLNAVRTLESRVSLIKSYLSSLTEADLGSEASIDGKNPKLSHPILRNINSLLSHLSILSPAEQSSFSTEVLSQSNDVQLISLLGKLGESVKSMRELGRKTAIIQSSQQAANVRQDPRGNMQRFNQDFFSQGGQGGQDGGMYA